MQEGKEKGAVVVEEAKQHKASLLVLGQKKRSIMWRLLRIWTRKRSRSRVVEYCIQKANCMTIAVRRKSSKYGGYLITTKRHKNFWLLAQINLIYLFNNSIIPQSGGWCVRMQPYSSLVKVERSCLINIPFFIQNEGIFCHFNMPSIFMVQNNWHAYVSNQSDPLNAQRENLTTMNT